MVLKKKKRKKEKRPKKMSIVIRKLKHQRKLECSIKTSTIKRNYKYKINLKNNYK